MVVMFCLDGLYSADRYALDAHTFLHFLILTCVAVYFFGTNATSATLFSSSTKSTAASPLESLASLS